MKSNARKLRDQLASSATEREQFERQKRELEAEMTKGKVNMDIIHKGLKGNEIATSDLIIDVPSAGNSGSPRGGAKKLIKRGTSHNLTSISNSSQSSIVNPSNGGSSPNQPRTTMLAHHQSFRPTGSFMGGLSGTLPSTSSSHDLSNVVHTEKDMKQIVIMPASSRVSDWCYLGTLDSSPPTVKSTDMYEFVRWLGRGSFGDVQLAKNIEKTLYAMKTIFSEHEIEIQKSLREVYFLRSFRHPYIVDLHDSFITQHPNILHIVMHYCEGGDLGKLITASKKNGSSINEHQIIKWSLQMALALHFLHENHILHRDLKPSNALLTDGGDMIKLADFGLTIELENNVCEKATEAGTPLYTAPEMINGEKYSYPTDCWSFGVMLHELMTLEPPFYKSDTTELVKSILSEAPPELPGQYSNELRTICKAFLAKNPQFRLGFAGMLLDPFMNGKVTAIPNSYRPKSLEERIRRGHAAQLRNQVEYLRYSSLSACALPSEVSQLVAAAEASPNLASSSSEAIVEELNTSRSGLPPPGSMNRRNSSRRTSSNSIIASVAEVKPLEVTLESTKEIMSPQLSPTAVNEKSEFSPLDDSALELSVDSTQNVQNDDTSPLRSSVSGGLIGLAIAEAIQFDRKLSISDRMSLNDSLEGEVPPVNEDPISQ